MLFEKDMDPRCAYCSRGTQLNETHVLCKKRGITLASGSCRSFRYDPLKRVPVPRVLPDFSHLKEEDFSL